MHIMYILHKILGSVGVFVMRVAGCGADGNQPGKGFSGRYIYRRDMCLYTCYNVFI